MISQLFFIVLIGMYDISFGLLPVVDTLPSEGVGNVLTYLIEAVIKAIQVGYSLPFFRLVMPWLATFLFLELAILAYGAGKTAWNFIRGSGA